MKPKRISLLALMPAVLLAAPAHAQAQPHPPGHAPSPAAPSPAAPSPGAPNTGTTGTAPAEGEAITLEQLERLALERNPTLRQSRAVVEIARGLKKQAGLYPNPVIHYHGEEIGQDRRAGQHGPRLEQVIVTGGKLSAARRVRGSEVSQAEALLRGREAAIRLNVRVLFYQALAAQERLQVRTRLLSVATETVETTRELHNIGLVKEPEVLQAQVEADRARLSLNQATTERFRTWQQLGALVGDPELSTPRSLAGSLETLPARLDPAGEMQRLLEQSPTLGVAQAGVTRAEAMLRRQRAERVPNLNVSFGPSYDFSSQRVIWEVDLAVPLPLFNRNQGNVQAAKGELERARAELDRVRLSLRSQFGPVFAQYEASLRQVEEYRARVLPNAARAYELSLEAYRRNAESFDQVLTAQRTFFQTQTEYLDALQQIQEAVAQLSGFFQNAALEEVTPLEPVALPENPANPFP